MIQKAIKYILNNNATFTNAIGTYTLAGGSTTMYKIFPAGYVPKGAGLPYCIHQLNNAEPFPTKDGTSYQDADHVVVTVFDYEYDDVMNLADYCRDALDGQDGTFNGVTAKIEFVRWNDDHVMMDSKPVFLYELEFECYNVK